MKPIKTILFILLMTMIHHNVHGSEDRLYDVEDLHKKLTEAMIEAIIFPNDAGIFIAYDDKIASTVDDIKKSLSDIMANPEEVTGFIHKDENILGFNINMNTILVREHRPATRGISITAISDKQNTHLKVTHLLKK